VVSPATIEIYAMLWSETSFLLLLILFMLLMGKALNEPMKQQWWILAAIVAGYAALTRYAGVTIIATGCLLFLLQSNWRQGLLRGLQFGVLASIPLTINLIRNKIHTDTFTGLRKPANTSILDNLRFTFDTIQDWLFLPFNVQSWIIGSIVLVLITVALFMRRKEAYGKILYSFALMYSVFMIV
jgi:4-amino-4-deoxy-L-arabinose transferase-like glycosyltransferase